MSHLRSRFMSQVLSSAAMMCGLLGQEEKVSYLKQQLGLIDGQDVPPIHQMVFKVCACYSASIAHVIYYIQDW